MTSLPDLLQQGSAHAWLFVPTAILLGALHGLEPGHSKTMMAAFIIAIRGTILQAVLLGVSATISHTAVVWIIALGGQYLGRGMDVEASEPYLQLASAVIILAVAAWMAWRTWRIQHPKAQEHAHDQHGHSHEHPHPHPHVHESSGLMLQQAAGYADDHERSHAQDIARRFKNTHVTTPQIVMFGLTGGLIPCPAAITVLLLCLQLKELALGAALVLSFSIGLAVTMVAAGVAASLSVKHIQKRWSGFSTLAGRAPYASAILMLIVGIYMGVHGWQGLFAHA